MTWLLFSFQVGIHITKLLMYLESSPFGSLGLDHMHMADFVQVDNEIKLVDLDDIHIGEPTCVRDSDCKIPEKPMKGKPLARCSEVYKYSRRS